MATSKYETRFREMGRTLRRDARRSRDKRLRAALCDCIAALAEHVVQDAQREGVAPSAVCPCETDTLTVARQVLQERTPA